MQYYCYYTKRERERERERKKGRKKEGKRGVQMWEGRFLTAMTAVRDRGLKAGNDSTSPVGDWPTPATTPIAPSTMGHC